MENSIFGYTFEQISAWQQRKSPITALPPMKVCSDAELLAMDLKLLEKHGQQGLEKMQYSGTLERLKANGIIK